MLEVIDNVDQWHGEGYRYFKVRSDDTSIYMLRFDEALRAWDLTMFKMPSRGLAKAFDSKE